MRRILWFRRDLRIEDNPLLSQEGDVLPVFIFDTNILNRLNRDDRRVTFIFEQVIGLKNRLQAIGLDLAIFYGDPETVFRHLIETLQPDEVCASGDYDSYARERDMKISHLLPFNYLHDTYIFRPDEVVKDDGSPYLVFTPFYKRSKLLFTQEHLNEHLPAPQTLLAYPCNGIRTLLKGSTDTAQLSLESIGFDRIEHQIPRIDVLLSHFGTVIGDYSTNRDYLALEGTSGLSVHLRFGTLGIRQLLRWLVARKQEGIDTEPVFRQLIFRDFYAYLLYHFPRIEQENYKYPFKGVENTAYYDAFCRARTGVPIIDAGIQQLLQTGNMHNRVRMICASFFTKDLLLPWQWGEAFFAAHLNDYDAASNILSWQWSSGTGVDPQPYFRIFNPYRQSERFDKEAVYIKRWLPQLASIPARSLHDEHYLLTHALTDYPQPIVSHKTAADAAKHYYATVLQH